MPQDVLAALFWQIQVEQNKIGAWRFVVGVGFIEKVSCLLSVMNDEQIRVDTGRGKGLPDEIHIGLVILDNEYLRALSRLCLMSG